MDEMFAVKRVIGDRVRYITWAVACMFRQLFRMAALASTISHLHRDFVRLCMDWANWTHAPVNDWPASARTVACLCCCDLHSSGQDTLAPYLDCCVLRRVVFIVVLDFD